jgi:capsular exopolysaccharide synthesis family protein
LLTERNNKAILITSSTGGEGKSFISINLAATLSLTGKKVVLLELDLRKPKISEHLNLNSRFGFSDYAIGKCSIDEIIVGTGVADSFFVIPSGAIPPNPAELIMLPRVDELFEQLRTDFDYIIIDTPPLGLVTDAQLLGRFADATLYVVRQGYTYKQQVKFANESYEGGRLPKMNIIVNDVHMGRGSSYAYRYGYGNGYYEDREDKSLVSKLTRKFKERK